jgi:hypothetical protein
MQERTGADVAKHYAKGGSLSAGRLWEEVD